jgi:DNA recombination protein RmuC
LELAVAILNSPDDQALEANMQLTIMHFTILFVGFASGGYLAWLILKGKLALADANGRATGEVERTSLSEQLKAASQEIASLKVRLLEVEGRSQKLQIDLDKANRECAQFTERAQRLIVVEENHKETCEVAEKLKRDVSDLREMNGRLTADIAAKQKRLIEIEQTQQNLSIERDALLKDQAGFLAKIAELNTTLNKERTQAQEKLELLNEAREQLSNSFKTLANEILDEKSKKFTDQNQANLDQLLNPLKQQLTDFKTKVEEVYVNEGKDRSVLTDQVKQLIQLNNSLSQDAQNLTLALKGDRKAQGNWGEIILDDVLEKAGLRAGQHYERQGSIKSEDGQSHVIPDVVLHLPGDRHLVVDSKMTLPDYRAFASADDEAERSAALKRHLISIRSHIKGLSEKNYQSLYGLKSLDFVVMFIPLEPAFMIAVTNDSELFQQAWDKNVLLVSPSTLLFVVRTVAYLWRQEDLSRNAKDISNRGAELYDKLVGFIIDLQKVGERIQQAQDSYNDARKKFSEGSGNVIRQAEMLKKLGVKPNKTLPAQWVGLAIEEAPQALGNESPNNT